MAGIVKEAGTGGLRAAASKVAARLAVALTVALLACAPVHAQPASLVADSLQLAGDGMIVASGNVEVFHNGTRLRATRVIYDRETETLQIDGPITIVGPDGVVITASRAELDSDFEAGLIQSARIVLDEQMQLAAVEGHRVGGRYNQLYRVTASACRICGDGPPLWQIRARRVVQDEVEKQIYFYDAYFDIGGVPVMYFPRLRMPDPSLQRASGFLFPTYRNSDVLGHGVKVPYFLVINDHADLKFTPYIAERTRTLEVRYRQAFRAGQIAVTGAISSDDVKPGQLRWYLDGEARFALPADFWLRFGGRMASDSTYASEYDYSGSDYLYNYVSIWRTRRYEHIELGASTYLPVATTATTEEFVGTLLYDRRFQPGLLGGEGRLVFDLEAPGNGNGLDEFHGHAEIGWRRDWRFGPGILGAFETALAGDYYSMRAGSGFPATITNFVPSVATEFRWPLSRTNRSGGSDVLEPLLQIAWAGTPQTAVPNEDSLLVEFDEGNLLSLSRFPGDDAYEQGLRAALGVNWIRFAGDGRQLGFSLARVVRLDDLGQFTPASGLDGGASDWLIAGGVDLGWFDVSNRTLLDDSFGVTKSATRFGLSHQRLSLAAGHLWQIADAAEGRATSLSEIAVAGGYEFNRHWSGVFDYRYDLVAGQASQAGLGVTYNNECLRVALTWAQKKIISTTTTTDTEFGLSVSLNGVGNDGRPYRRACRI